MASSLDNLMDEWVTDSNEAFYLNLTRSTSSKDKPQRVLDEPFNPSFTYEIYGDEQKLVGYKEPAIYLDFRANDLTPSLDIQFKQKLDLATIIPEFEQVDLEEPLKDILPSYVFESSENNHVPGPDPTSQAWTPPGKLIRSFKQQGKDYEIWGASLADPRALQIFRNMQILVILFIEGGSQLELDEPWTLDRWTLYLMYEVTPLKNSSASPYTIAGFSTSYRYWVFPTLEVMRAIKAIPSPPASDSGHVTDYHTHLTQDPKTHLINEQINTLEVQSRERISQFIILPPYQRRSLGSELYETIFGVLVKVSNVWEIPVEDPSEAFDAMRDYSDMAYLRRMSSFEALSLASSIPPDKMRKDAPIPRDLILGNGADLDAIRHESKIVPRQFNRLVEMHLLSTIPTLSRSTARLTRKDKSSNENDRKYYFWRLAVKDRIYRQSADVLDQLEDHAEKVQKLEDAVDNVVDEYSERLQGIDKRVGKGPQESQNSANKLAKRKRVVVDDDDEDDADSVASSKKIKA
ncbi:acyl-CoA N-acyltransferase [Polyplosphaeria fusca]|uniref:Histone acetyltransferase type B catalytic subunit n=1 Tax=Polyplosphaeria fusca TaxID=682080 RepID=A0A9P4QTI9_9PLEO|nr:acyl-CoA N-acyltransferase [Polyplosphaeria fusca]